MAEAVQALTNQDGGLPTAHPRALWEKSEVWCGNGYLAGVGTGKTVSGVRVHKGITILFFLCLGVIG